MNHRPWPSLMGVFAHPDWGLPAADQLAAVHQARARLGIPRAARQPLTELPDATDLITL
ncbi:hypothetical protein [Streptomyces sp. NPDC049590]|uniref:hypothetical protein n=1 Tax=Streptomyces sp. NPDC049590 TaxID=3154834 RepID=UPI003449025F